MDDGRVILYRLSFEIPAGRRTVILGPPKSGKTTLVRHLVGLDPPGAGDVRIGGAGLWTVDLEGRNNARAGLAVMLTGRSRFASLLSSMSVYDNVAYQLRLGSLSEAEIDEHVMTALDALDLTQFADRLPEEISERARRRLTLARALAPNASLLVLDGPETVFDADRVEQTTRVVLAAHRRRSATIIIATSDIDLARRAGQHLVILGSGRVPVQGDPATLLDGIRDLDDLRRRFRYPAADGSPDPERARVLIETADRSRRERQRVTARYYVVLIAAVVTVVVFIGLYYLLLGAAG